LDENRRVGFERRGKVRDREDALASTRDACATQSTTALRANSLAKLIGTVTHLNPMKLLIQSKTTIPLIFIPLLLACLGLAPMARAVGPDTDGSIPGSNNGEGIGVLVSRTSGVWNTGTGFEALNHLTAGNQNTATGLRALNSDTNGGFNTATGVFSLFSNTSGFFNSATGAYSLAHNISGTQNTANGYAALCVLLDFRVFSHV